MSENWGIGCTEEKKKQKQTRKKKKKTSHRRFHSGLLEQALFPALCDC